MKIVILEDNVERQGEMRHCLADRFGQFDTLFFAVSSEMNAYLDAHLSETLAISLDHDLDLLPGANGTWIDPGTGREVADFLAGRAPVCPIIIHTTNVPAAAGMEFALQEASWVTERVVPHDDLEWIAADWFPALRRAIVGPVNLPATSG
jgi:hypothetical protein